MSIVAFLNYPRMLRLILRELADRSAIRMDADGKYYLAIHLHGFEQRVDWNDKQRRLVRFGPLYDYDDFKDSYTPLSIHYRTAPQVEPTYLVFRHASNFIEWYDTVTTGCAITARNIREKRMKRPAL